MSTGRLATARVRRKKVTNPKMPVAVSHPPPTLLKGWKSIAEFLGQPMNVAQRWSRSGMPVRREGRFTVATPDELSRWLGRESGVAQPVHIAAGTDTDLAAELRKSLSAAKHGAAAKRK
jgi:hypothetical protein